MAGSSQVIGSAFKIAIKAGIPTGRNGGISISSKVRVLSPNHPNGYEVGGTLLKIGSKYKNVRIDVGIKQLLHINVQLSKQINKHLRLGIIGAGLLGGLLRD